MGSPATRSVVGAKDGTKGANLSGNETGAATLYFAAFFIAKRRDIYEKDSVVSESY